MIDKSYTNNPFKWLFILHCVMAAFSQNTQAQILSNQENKAIPKVGNKARIISLSPAATEALFYIGAGEQLVGRTKACNYPELVKTVPDVGSMFPPSPENILRLKPELIIMTRGFNSLREKLTKWNIPVYTYEPESLLDIAHHLRQLGTLTNREASAEVAATKFEKELETLSRMGKYRDKLVYWEVGSQPMITAGGKTFISDLIEHAGGKNIFSDLHTPWPKVSNETVIRRKPHFFFTTEKIDNITTNRPWTALLSLEKDHFIYINEPDLVHRPSPRVLDGLKWLITSLKSGS